MSYVKWRDALGWHGKFPILVILLTDRQTNRAPKISKRIFKVLFIL